MIRLLRIFGFLLIGAGAIVLISYLIKPLRGLWPLFRDLPLPIQIGIGIAAAGLVILIGTIVWERLEDRESDLKLKDSE